MRAAFGRQGHARGRRHQHEARVLVAGVVQRIEAALDERIVERADRQQPRAEQRRGEAQRGELEEQIVLGDAELDVLALRRHRPALRRDDLFLAKRVGALGAVEDAAPVDPRPEIGRDRDVGRGRDDALGELAVARRRCRPGSCRSLPASTAWRRAGPAGSAAPRSRRRSCGAGRPRRAAPARGRPQAARPAGRGPANCPIRRPSAIPMLLLKRAIWSRFIRPEWLSLWPAKGRP